MRAPADVPYLGLFFASLVFVACGSESSGTGDLVDSGPPLTTDAGSQEQGQPAADAGITVTDTSAADAGALGDASADAASTADDAPGGSCVGTLTDAALVTLLTSKLVKGVPSYVELIIPGRNQARLLGKYTTALYKRQCDSNTGCNGWVVAPQPNYETFFSISAGVRQGSLYLSSDGGKTYLTIVSDTIGSVAPGECIGWTQGGGTLERNGVDASVKLATSVEDTCLAGEDPASFFNEIDLYDPTGIVTDHCMKLVYRKELNRVDIGPNAFVYDEYAVVYEATY